MNDAHRPAAVPTADASPPRSRRVFSIRWIVTGVAVALTAAAVLSVGAVAERSARAALTREIQARLTLDARNLGLAATSALLGEFPELTLHPMAREMQAHQPELAFAMVVDRHGIVQGHSDPRLLGTRYVPPSDLVATPQAGDLMDGEWLKRNPEVLVVQTPVRHPDGRVLGSCLVGMRRSYLDNAVTAARRRQVVVLAVLLVIGALTALLLVSQLLQPIVKLRAGIERIGRGDLETPLALHGRTELGLLADAINDMRLGLRRGQAEMVERGRLAHELDLARQIQRSLLPHEPLRTGEFTIEGAQSAAAEVGGDYYDIFALPGGRIGVAVADVAGKGLAGCLVMSMLSALLRALRETTDSPAELLARIDERLSETLQPGGFVTMFYGVLDPASGRLIFASAGHNPVLVYRHADATVDRQHARGIPLGAISRAAVRGSLDDLVVDLGPGDVLIQYTDGLNESLAPGSVEQFGFDRMEDVLRRTGGGPPGDVIDGLRAALRVWTGGGAQADDETVLVVRREPGARVRPVLLGCGDPLEDPEARYLEAQRRGRCLLLPARLEALDDIHGWLRTCPLVRELPAPELELLGTSLYEAAGNVIEHGYRQDDRRSLELWWLPALATASSALPDLAARVNAGLFLMRDQGEPFRGDQRPLSDFADPGVWARGRGFGLDIIHRAMERVVYHPGSPLGNVTLMKFARADLRGLGKETRIA